LTKAFQRLVFQFQPVHQKEHAAGVAGAQEELDDGGGGERLAGAGGHFEQEAVFALALTAALHGVHDGLELVGAQEAQAVGSMKRGRSASFFQPASEA
jgi:hypothetical protein